MLTTGWLSEKKTHTLKSNKMNNLRDFSGVDRS
jgi:hypothetical protein